mgnify:CR=1 FL=1
MTLKEKYLYFIITMQTIVIIFNNIAHEFLKTYNSFLGTILIILTIIMIITTITFKKIAKKN